MSEILKLANRVKHYDWGSPDDIPRLLGLSADGRPWAELWMGTHSSSPSRVCLPDGEVTLGELIGRSPGHYLGAKTAERYGVLPFLLKLLAAEKPLSIQAHPNLAQAREGFARENKAGLLPDAPNRNYRDSNHKPEIVCALTPFTGMCGFREPRAIQRRLAAFLTAPLQDDSALDTVCKGFGPLFRTLEESAASTALQNFLKALFELSPAVREALTEYVFSVTAALPLAKPLEFSPCENSIDISAGDWELMRRFARLYPGDPAVIAPLYLNTFHLQPGEAVFLQAGVLHAYIHGFAVELMASSDNVLRGGLTSKYVDVPELMRVLDFSPFMPQIIKPEPGVACFSYPIPCEEFALTVMHGEESGLALPEGPAICVVSEGEAVFPNQGMVLKQGESAFIPPVAAGEEPFLVQGHYTLYAASVP